LKANALKLALEAKKKDVSVYVGMRYWYPFTEEAVEQVCIHVPILFTWKKDL